MHNILFHACFYSGDEVENQGKRSTSSPHLLDLVSAALTSWKTGWSGACSHSLGNGFAGRLQEEQGLHIKYTHRFLKASLKIPP